MPGRTYYLNVETGGKIYTATSMMKSFLRIDSISKIYNNEPYGAYHEAGYIITCHCSDATVDNFVAIFAKKNGRLSEEIYFLNGIFDSDIEEVYQEGDTAEVELCNLNEDIYHYYTIVNQISGADGNFFNMGKIPCNPVTNLSNGALGYFGVYPVDKSIMIIEE
jgi:hypothetical protein